MKGTYFLVTYCSKNFQNIIGKTRIQSFKIGYYIYIGSAMGKGSSSLRFRILRHVKSAFTKEQAHKHWHIDYFLTLPEITLISVLINPNSSEKQECKWSNYIKQHSNGCINGFGSSDCLCLSHLYYFLLNNEFIDNLLHS